MQFLRSLSYFEQSLHLQTIILNSTVKKSLTIYHNYIVLSPCVLTPIPLVVVEFQMHVHSTFKAKTELKKAESESSTESVVNAPEGIKEIYTYTPQSKHERWEWKTFLQASKLCDYLEIEAAAVLNAKNWEIMDPINGVDDYSNYGSKIVFHQIALQTHNKAAQEQIENVVRDTTYIDHIEDEDNLDINDEYDHDEDKCSCCSRFLSTFRVDPIKAKNWTQIGLQKMYHTFSEYHRHDESFWSDDQPNCEEFLHENLNWSENHQAYGYIFKMNDLSLED